MEAEKIREIKSKDIDCYRGTGDGCIIYLKDGSLVNTKLTFEEVDKIFNVL